MARPVPAYLSAKPIRACGVVNLLSSDPVQLSKINSERLYWLDVKALTKNSLRCELAA